MVSRVTSAHRLDRFQAWFRLAYTGSCDQLKGGTTTPTRPADSALHTPTHTPSTYPPTLYPVTPRRTKTGPYDTYEHYITRYEQRMLALTP